MKIPPALPALLSALIAWPATAEPTAAGFPSYPGLDAGRQTWLAVCRECHANSLSDAPQVTDRAAWEKRSAAGREVLLGHALNGYSSTGESEMPARGGNQELSDEQVAAALDYMLRLIAR